MRTGRARSITLHSRARLRTPTLLLTFADRSVQDGYRFLAELDVNAPAGTFYASNLPAGSASMTVACGSAWPPTAEDDIDRLLEGLARLDSA